MRPACPTTGDDTLRERRGDRPRRVRTSGLDAAGQAAAAADDRRAAHVAAAVLRRPPAHPLADEQIVRPMFATGEPRSGTTLLHALLSVDPGARALRFWEVMYPSPPPGPAPAPTTRVARRPTTTGAISSSASRVAGQPPVQRPARRRAAGVRADLGVRLPGDDAERVVAGADDRCGPRLPQDPVAQYRIHRMVLQHVQFGRPEQRWVLKGFHGRRLAALFDTYPDACVIWVHRDPVQVIASQITAFGQINECLAGSPRLAGLRRRPARSVEAELPGAPRQAARRRPAHPPRPLPGLRA